VVVVIRGFTEGELARCGGCGSCPDFQAFAGSSRPVAEADLTVSPGLGTVWMRRNARKMPGNTSSANQVSCRTLSLYRHSLKEL
jgi:hypothetical protein